MIDNIIASDYAKGVFLKDYLEKHPYIFESDLCNVEGYVFLDSADEIVVIYAWNNNQPNEITYTNILDNIRLNFSETTLEALLCLNSWFTSLEEGKYKKEIILIAKKQD